MRRGSAAARNIRFDIGKVAALLLMMRSRMHQQNKVDNSKLNEITQKL